MYLMFTMSFFLHNPILLQFKKSHNIHTNDANTIVITSLAYYNFDFLMRNYSTFDPLNITIAVIK